MAHLRSASQAGDLGKHALRVEEEDEGGGASKKQRKPPEKLKQPVIIGVPSTWGLNKKAKADGWRKDMAEQVDAGKQMTLSFAPAQLVLQKKVRNHTHKHTQSPVTKQKYVC
jgi:hypothetical protein